MLDVLERHLVPGRVVDQATDQRLLKKLRGASRIAEITLGNPLQKPVGRMEEEKGLGEREARKEINNSRVSRNVIRAQNRRWNVP